MLIKQTTKSCIDLAVPSLQTFVHLAVTVIYTEFLGIFKADGMCRWFESRKRFESQSVNGCDGVAQKF